MAKIICIDGRGSFYKKIAKSNQFSTHQVNFRRADIFINYGKTSWPAVDVNCYGKDIQKINCIPFPNKYTACMFIGNETDVAIPEVRLSPPYKKDKALWIVKPLRSFAGKNISEWDGEKIPKEFYFQKRIQNRRYELRVHAFSWMNPSNWIVQKRTHPDGDSQLTWNHHTGGYFTTIENGEGNTGVFKRAKESAKKVIELLGYSFGAVDFIVSNDDKPLVPYFIEVNAAPGFSIEQMIDYYNNAFSLLK